MSNGEGAIAVAGGLGEALGSMSKIVTTILDNIHDYILLVIDYTLRIMTKIYEWMASDPLRALRMIVLVANLAMG
jgi:hypothetical protein